MFLVWTLPRGGWIEARGPACLVHLRDCLLQPEDVRRRAGIEQAQFNFVRRFKRAQNVLFSNQQPELPTLQVSAGYPSVYEEGSAGSHGVRAIQTSSMSAGPSPALGNYEIPCHRIDTTLPSVLSHSVETMPTTSALTLTTQYTNPVSINGRVVPS